MGLRNAFEDLAVERTQSVEITDLLHSILAELRIMNFHLSTLTEHEISYEEIENDGY